MATVQRTTTGPVNKAKLMVQRAKLELSLPTELSVPVDDLNEYHGLITGEPGTGKTTLGMQQEGVLLLTFDPVQKSLKALQRHCPDWEHFAGYLKMLKEAASKRNFPYRRVLVDGADLWFRSCQRHVCRKLGIEHPADGDWGKGWDALNVTFTQAVDDLMALPCGSWFICHAKDKEVEMRDGTKVEKLRPVLTNRAEEILVGKCNFVLNIQYVSGSKRMGVIRNTDDVMAKCNIDGRFLARDGRQVVEIALGDQGPAEAYRRFASAFNNEQAYVTYQEYKQKLAAQAAKKGAPATAKK